jgi:hypothetical protein
MPRIADYNAFSDGIRSLPNANGDIDFDLEFDLLAWTPALARSWPFWCSPSDLPRWR